MAPSRFRKRASTLKTVELLNNLGHGSGKTQRPGQSKDGSHDTNKPQSDDVGDTTGLSEDLDGTRRRSGRVRQSRGLTGVGTGPDVSTAMGDTEEDENGKSSEDSDEQGAQDENEDGSDGEDEQDKEDKEDEDENHDIEEPRSEDVWDIMGLSQDMDGGKRQSQVSTGAEAEPDMPTGLGDGGEGEDEDESGSEESSEDDSKEQEDEEGLDESNLEDHGPEDMLYLFSEDENEARRSQSQSRPQLSSPSVLNKQPTTSYGENQDGSRSLQSDSRLPRPEVHIEIRGTASKPSVRQDKSIQHDKSIQEDDDEPIQHDESSDSAPESSESSSSELKSESDSKSYSTPEPPQLHKRRRVLHEEDKDRTQSSRHVRISPHGNDADAGGVDHKARDLQWMQKAMKLGQQRDNWLVVTTTAKELSRMADDPDGTECDDICAMIRGLRGLYGEMDRTSSSSSSITSTTGTTTSTSISARPSTATLTQCDHLFSSISGAADKLLDRVYYQATEDGPCSGAQELLAEFDARVVPGLVRLIIACFRVYYFTPLLFSGLPGHLRRFLLLLRGLWVRTTSMKAQRIVVHGSGGVVVGGSSAVKHGKAFGQAIHGILQALETGALRPQNLPRNDNANANANYSQIGREWTRDEGLALIDGLQLYHGTDFISFSPDWFYEITLPFPYSVQGNWDSGAKPIINGSRH